MICCAISQNCCQLAGGWFHTGDQGFLDEEGYLTLTGRIKELINRGGEKISPIEVRWLGLAYVRVCATIARVVAVFFYVVGGVGWEGVGGCAVCRTVFSCV